MGLSSALNIGKAGIAVNQKAIEIAGNNISNVNTPGYSRQTGVFSSLPTLNINGFAIGQGVRIDEVTRQHDSFLNQQINDKNAAYGEESGKSTPLAQLEAVFNISENGLSGRIDSFFKSWQGLSSNPGDTVARQNVLMQADALAQEFHQVDGDIQAVRDNINNTLESSVDSINDKLKEIAELNHRIAGIESAGQTAASDRDRRDILLEELSFSLGAQSLEEDNGMVSVFVGGGVNLVQGQFASTLEAARVSGDVQFQLKSGSSTFNLTSDSLGGEVKGLMEVRDQVIPSLQSDLNALAYSLATEVNTLHAAGTGLDGSTGLTFFDPIDPADQSSAAANLSVAIQDTRQLAAGTTSATGDNTNAVKIAELLEQPVVNGTQTFSGFYAGMASKIGREVSQNELSLSGNEDALTQLKNVRDSKTGVSLEEEMISLIQYQQGFEASAKLLSVVDEMMSQLMNIKR